MKLQSLRPILWVDDVEATIKYYVEVLQFTRSRYVDHWQWGFVVRDEVEIMFAKVGENDTYKNGPVFTGSLYLNTDNVEGWWELLKNKANIFYPIENFEHGMREFGIKDCNGYIVQFGEEAGK